MANTDLIIAALEQSRKDMMEVIEVNQRMTTAEIGALNDMMKIQFKSVMAKQDKTNGSIMEHNKEIENLKLADLKHIVDCPAMPKIEELRSMIHEEDLDIEEEIRDIKKDILGSWLRKHWKLALIITLALLYFSYTLFELVNIVDILKTVLDIKM